MTQAWTVVWAQWRSYRNVFNRSSVAVGIVMGTLWYGFWTAAAVVAAFVLARSDVDMIGPLSGGLLLMTLYWQLIPMMMAASGMSLDLAKLKCYPIPVRDLFTIEVLLRVTAAAEMLLLLLGASIGLLFRPNLPAWGALAAIPFAAMQLLFSLGFRDIVIRVLSKRRLREITSLLFILIFMLPRLLVGRGIITSWLAAQFTARGFSDAIPLWPWTAAGHFMMGQQVGIASLALLGWTGLAGVFALWQFRRTLDFDVEAAQSAGESPAKAKRVGFMERFYRLPSAILGDPLATMVEKELRYLARSPQFRMLFLMSCVFGLVIVQGTFRRAYPSWAPTYFVITSAYALLLMGGVCIWNVFAFDRSAAQMYFVAPVPFAQVLISKNLAAAVWIGIQFWTTLVLCAALRFPITLDRIAEGIATTTVVMLALLSIGNYVAVSNPRPIDPQASMRTRSPGGKQLLMILIYPLTLLPVSLAYLTRWALDSEVAFFAALGVLGALAFVVYRVGLDYAANYAVEHKEQIVTALSAGQSPIST